MQNKKPSLTNVHKHLSKGLENQLKEFTYRSLGKEEMQDTLGGGPKENTQGFLNDFLSQYIWKQAVELIGFALCIYGAHRLQVRQGGNNTSAALPQAKEIKHKVNYTKPEVFKVPVKHQALDLAYHYESSEGFNKINLKSTDPARGDLKISLLRTELLHEDTKKLKDYVVTSYEMNYTLKELLGKENKENTSEKLNPEQ